MVWKINTNVLLPRLLAQHSRVLLIFMGGGRGKGGGARLTVRISFIVGLSTCGCGYVNGTLFVSTGELSYIVKYSFRLWYHNSFGNFTGIQKNILWLGWVIA